VLKITSAKDFDEQRNKLMRGPLPSHIGVIMDGNGRWAQARGQQRVVGHQRGAEALRETIKECIRLGIQYLSAFAFSTENWRRPKEEVHALMKLMGEFAASEAEQLVENGVQVVPIGEIYELPERTRNQLEKLARRTREGNNLILLIAINYGGRKEIHRAVREISKKTALGTLRAEEIDEECVRMHLLTHPYPDPDLIIRTGGEWRLSNFLLYQAAYAEFVCCDVFWPDFGPEHLHSALTEYQKRERRFGRVFDEYSEDDQ